MNLPYQTVQERFYYKCMSDDQPKLPESSLSSLTVHLLRLEDFRMEIPYFMLWKNTSGFQNVSVVYSRRAFWMFLLVFCSIGVFPFIFSTSYIWR